MRLWEARAPSAPVYLGHAVKRSGRVLFSRPLWSRITRPGVLLASAAIRLYQRYLSPLKGYRCAHGVLHHGPGCSEAVRRIILRRGVFGAWPLVKKRFAACRQAAATLRARMAGAQHVRAAALAGALAVTSMAALAHEDKRGAGAWGAQSACCLDDAGERSRREAKLRECHDRLETAVDAADCIGNNPDCASNCAPNIDPGCGAGIDPGCISGIDCGGVDCGGLNCGGF